MYRSQKPYTALINEISMRIFLNTSQQAYWLLSSIFSTLIFSIFRQLRCDRITVHKNLFVSYIITAFCFVIYLSVVSFGDGVLMENPVSVRNFLHTMYSCRFEYMNFTYCQTCKSKNNSKTQLISIRQTDAIFWRQTSTLFITSDSPRQRSGKVNERSTWFPVILITRDHTTKTFTSRARYWCYVTLGL